MVACAYSGTGEAEAGGTLALPLSTEKECLGEQDHRLEVESVSCMRMLAGKAFEGFALVTCPQYGLWDPIMWKPSVGKHLYF